MAGPRRLAQLSGWLVEVTTLFDGPSRLVAAEAVLQENVEAMLINVVELAHLSNFVSERVLQSA